MGGRTILARGFSIAGMAELLGRCLMRGAHSCVSFCEIFVMSENCRVNDCQKRLLEAEIGDLRGELERSRGLLTLMLHTESSAPAQQQPWQNIDNIIDALEAAGCCHGGMVRAPEDVVANAIRDWMRSASERAKDAT